LSQVLRMAWQETVLFLACALAFTAMVTNRIFESPAIALWSTMLAIQAVPYLAAVVTAVLSAFSNNRVSPTLAAQVTETKPVLPRAA
jgi:hypothetical protein